MRQSYRALPLVFLVAGGLAACSDDTVTPTFDAKPADAGTSLDAKPGADAATDAGASADASPTALQDKVDTIVVIYAENRGFDNMYGTFPGANGIPGVNPTSSATALIPQIDRDGTVLAELPRFWGGIAPNDPLVDNFYTVDQTAGLENAPFLMPMAFPNINEDVINGDLVHRFFTNQMQINGGKNDSFAAWSDAGGEVMGYFAPSTTELWKLAKDNVLADNLFMGAFGGSFLNHQYLICACAPEYANADLSPANSTISVIDTDNTGKFLRVTVKTTDPGKSPASALDGKPVFVGAGDGQLSPKGYFGDNSFHGINTMQPPYQPSSVAPPASDATKLLADPGDPRVMPPQTAATIGDLLDAKTVSWAWYSTAYKTTLSLASGTRKFELIAKDTTTQYQFHHQPFNYYQKLDPINAAAYRAQHVKDYTDLISDAAQGHLPNVVFYKPMGEVNQHPGYANISEGDQHIAQLVSHLQSSPQYGKMVIIITYDENGGFWDHVAPPKADLLGPGSRIPAIIISPLAKKGFVDHTLYDTSSAIRLMIRRFGLDTLPGLTDRDTKLQAGGSPKIGDLTNALSL